jgi:hypothetical protein
MEFMKEVSPILILGIFVLVNVASFLLGYIYGIYSLTGIRKNKKEKP